MSAGRAKRLEVVLRVRRLTEDRAKLDLGRAAARLAAARSARDTARRRLGEEEAWLAALHRRTTNGGDFAAATGCLALADELVEAADRAIVAAAESVRLARERLADATRARSVVERLRDRAMEAARLEDERREISELAELAGVRHAWRVIAGEPT